MTTTKTTPTNHSVVEFQTSFSDASKWFYGFLAFTFAFLSPFYSEHQFWCKLISSVGVEEILGF